MGLVSEVDDTAAPTVLLVDNNPMSTHRLANLFKVKNFNVVICEDGDQAVDEYIRIDPELVLLSLDLPSLDGHLAALEMREHGGEERVVFIAPRRMASLARDAAYSAGAVAWLEKPVSAEGLASVWSRVLGPIPEAPGLEDLDSLYPGRIQVEADEGPLLPLPATLPLPLPDVTLLPDLPTVVPAVHATSKPKKGKKRLFLMAAIGFVAVGVGYAYQQGMLPV